MARTRTTIELDDDHVREIKRRYRLSTTTEAVDLALRRLAGAPMTRDEALAMQGTHSIDELPPDAPPRGLDE